MSLDPALSYLALLMLAVVFGLAAATKLKDPDVFASIVEQYELLPGALVQPFARALPVVEAAAALGLLVPATRALAAAVLILLLLAFAGAMAINLVRGRSDIDCGCFVGVQKQRISWALVLRNVLLAGFGLSLLVETTGRTLGPLDWFTILTGAASLLLLNEALGRLFGLAPAATRRAV